MEKSSNQWAPVIAMINLLEFVKIVEYQSIAHFLSISCNSQSHPQKDTITLGLRSILDTL